MILCCSGEQWWQSICRHFPWSQDTCILVQNWKTKTCIWWVPRGKKLPPGKYLHNKGYNICILNNGLLSFLGGTRSSKKRCSIVSPWCYWFWAKNGCGEGNRENRKCPTTQCCLWWELQLSYLRYPFGHKGILYFLLSYIFSYMVCILQYYYTVYCILCVIFTFLMINLCDGIVWWCTMLQDFLVLMGLHRIWADWCSKWGL